MILQALIVLASSAASTSSTSWPAISFEGTSVVATGITSGGRAAWFSVALGRCGTVNCIIPRERLDVDAGKGTVTFEVDGKVPSPSIWAVVDLATGQFAVASPGRANPPEIPFPVQALINGTNGQPAELAADADLIKVFLARPGAGAWVLTARRGGPLDVGQGANKQTRVAFSSMQAIGDSGPPPSELQNGDVIIVIDVLNMTFFADRRGGAN